MNQYLQGMQNEAAARGVPFEEPNGWSQMLMNVASTNNSWSAEQAQKQMDFQERMSDTAHQREVADLKAAGLNPVLSAKLGGASTPTGSTATADTSIVSSIVNLMNKMLDVQGTSAAAAYNASGGYSQQYGNGSDGSAINGMNANDKGTYVDENGVIRREASTSSGNLIKGLLTSLHVPNARDVGNTVTSFYNGIKGAKDNISKNSDKTAYGLGQAVRDVLTNSPGYKAGGSLAQSYAKAFSKEDSTIKKIAGKLKK